MARKKKAVEEEAPPAPQQEAAEAKAAVAVEEALATPLFEAALEALNFLVETNPYQMDARYKERGKAVIEKLVAVIG